MGEQGFQKGRERTGGRPKLTLEQKNERHLARYPFGAVVRDGIIDALNKNERELNLIINNSDSTALDRMLAGLALKCAEGDTTAINVALDRTIGRPLVQAEITSVNSDIDPEIRALEDEKVTKLLRAMHEQA